MGKHPHPWMYEPAGHASGQGWMMRDAASFVSRRKYQLLFGFLLPREAASGWATGAADAAVPYKATVSTLKMRDFMLEGGLAQSNQSKVRKIDCFSGNEGLRAMRVQVRTSEGSRYYLYSRRSSIQELHAASQEAAILPNTSCRRQKTIRSLIHTTQH